MLSKTGVPKYVMYHINDQLLVSAVTRAKPIHGQCDFVERNYECLTSALMLHWQFFQANRIDHRRPHKEVIFVSCVYFVSVMDSVFRADDCNGSTQGRSNFIS